MTEYDPTEPVPGLQQAITGVVAPPITASYRDALLEVKTHVERVTDMHEQVGRAIGALFDAQRQVGVALNGLLSSIGTLITAQEVETRRAGFAGRGVAALARDLADNPRGHPCRNCGRYFDEHRPAQEGDGDMHCEEWR